jgi:hypothetical protein
MPLTLVFSMVNHFPFAQLFEPAPTHQKKMGWQLYAANPFQESQLINERGRLPSSPLLSSPLLSSHRHLRIWCMPSFLL